MSVTFSTSRNKAAVEEATKSPTKLATTKTLSTQGKPGAATAQAPSLSMLKTPPSTPAKSNGSLRADVTPVKTVKSTTTSIRDAPAKSTSGSIRDASPARKANEPTSPKSPRPEDIAQVVAWQTDVDDLEQKQVELQNNQMNLLHNQIHILTRELGDLQNKFVNLEVNMKAAQEEAHSALRLELAEHGNNAAEMKAAWEEAHQALKTGMDEGLSNLAEQHAQALEAHKTEQSKVMADLMGGSGNSLSDLESLHNQRYEEHSACLEQGLEGVHNTLQKELAELRSGHAVNLQAVVTDVTDQVDKLTKDVEQMAQDLKAAQEEAHSALRLELAEHGNNAAEMKAAWEEAHNALSAAMDDGLSNLAEQHAKALEGHKADQAQALADHAENLANHGSNLSELEDVHNKRYEEHSASLEKGLEDVHSTLQKELAELRSGHAVNLQAVVTDVTDQVDKLTKDVEQMAEDLKAAQEEAHSALRLELAEHGNNAADMKAAWEEAHKALTQSMDDNLASLAADHAKALEDHKADQSQALADHADTHGSNLADLEDVHNKRYEEHAACLQQGLDGVHSTLQKELEELRSGHAVNLQAVVTDVTSQVDKLTLDVEQLAKDVTAAQEEAHSALRLELAEHGNNAADMKAAWEEAHKALTQSMDDNLASLAADHAKALENHKEEHARALADHADSQGNSLTDLEALHNKRYEEHNACLQQGLEDVHGTLQKELADLRSGHAVNLKEVVTDVTAQVDKLTLDLETLAKDVATAQEEAHSALRLELAQQGDDAAEMKAAWEEAHSALSQALDDGLSNLADQHAKALDDHKVDQASALESHGNNLADIQAMLKGEIDTHANNLSDMQALYDAKHDEHAQNTAKMERGLQDVLESTHGKLQSELADLRSGHAVSIKKVLEDLTEQTDNITLSLEQESELRKIMELKLDKLFDGLRGVMSVTFLGDGADEPPPTAPPAKTQQPSPAKTAQPTSSSLAKSPGKAELARKPEPTSLFASVRGPLGTSK